MTMVQSKSQSKKATSGQGKDKKGQKGGKAMKKNGQSAQPEGLVPYFKSVAAEGKKVTWPTMPQVWANTVIVLLMTVLFSIGLWGVDNTFRYLIHLLTVDLPRLIA